MGRDELITALVEYFPQLSLPVEKLGSPVQVLAGSFPLYFVYQSVDPQLWHRSTRSEILLLYWISKAMLGGRSLPQPALERIGHWLQVSPFDEDFRSGAVDIDLITNDSTVWELEGGRWFSLEASNVLSLSYSDDDAKTRGRYFLLEPGIGRTVYRLTNRRPTVDQFYLRDNKNIHAWIDAVFDFSFCKVTFDGCTLRTSPESIAMRGYANLNKYRRMWASIDHAARERQRHPLPAFDIYALDPVEIQETVGAALATLMQERLDKYNRRRFTVTNEAELRQLIAEVWAWSREVSQQRDASPKRSKLNQ